MAESRKQILETMSRMIAIPAISPLSGGDGESKRADYLEKVLRGWGLKARRFDYKDESGAKRSNLVVKHGNAPKTIWILPHIDTVSEGDMSAWKSDPFKVKIKGDLIIGRGVEDNGHAVIAGMYALKSLLGKKLKYNFGLVLAADEETDSVYGVKKLLKEGIFRRGDMFIVPDWGHRDGAKIEIAEKGIIWLKVTVHGQQVHASDPHKGKNALRIAAQFMLDIDRYLHKKYAIVDRRFGPPYSTFEMTKNEKNVESINILPGKEVFYLDFRVLPNYRIDAIIRDINRIKRKYDAKIDIETVQRSDPAPPTSERSEVVRMLAASIKKEIKVSPQTMGIGGGTIAAPFRKAGYEVAVWSMQDNCAHQPNEFMRISNIMKMIRVFARIFS
ncbi:MAG: M20 family metallo-hydrolase [Candidatus Micrarchaeota archaeon]|nr:M20 family metallo-hydrolase [Candidatus Micrarchaeota archaeon]